MPVSFPDGPSGKEPVCQCRRYKNILAWKSQGQSVLPVVRVPGRERRLLETMQLVIGEFITDSSLGLPPSPRV